MNFFYLSFLLIVIESVIVSGKINGTIHRLTKVSISRDCYSFVNAKGEFSLHNVQDGQYTISVDSPQFSYPKVSLVVNKERISMYPVKTGVEFDSPFAELEQPLVIPPLGQFDYFTPKESFNILSTLMNPMVWMMGLSILLMFAMPKMMENLDPEELEELKKQQAKITGQLSRNLPS